MNSENKLIVIIPFCNVSEFIERCVGSLMEQEYSNYLLFFADDNSEDGSIHKIPDNKNIIKKRSGTRLFALENIYRSLMSAGAQEDDIIIIVDGDDYLLNNRVFYKINEFYKKRNCLLSYGQYCTDQGAIGLCGPYSPDEFTNLRAQRWRASHLKTFRFKLFKAFLEQDPLLNAYRDEKGRFYSMAYDVALMYPLMEIAGYPNVYFSKEVLYVYRVHPRNDMATNRDLQIRCEKAIQSKQPFKRAF